VWDTYWKSTVEISHMMEAWTIGTIMMTAPGSSE